MIRYLATFLLLLFSLPADPTYAADADDPAAKLYRAEVIITGVLEPERMRGFREGLREVFTKVTNAPELANDPRLQQYIDKAQDFVAEFTLEDRNKHLKLNDEQGTRDRPHFLRMRMDKAKLDAAIAALGYTPWLTRPVFDVLLVVRDARAPFVIGDELPANQPAGAKVQVGSEAFKLANKTWDGFEQREVLKSVARRRGYDFLFPQRLDPKADGAAVPVQFAEPEAGRTVVYWRGELIPDASGFFRLESKTWKVGADGGIVDTPQCFSYAKSGVTFDISITESLDQLAKLYHNGVPQNCQ